MLSEQDRDWLIEELGATIELSGMQIRPAALGILAGDLAHIPKGLLKLAIARIRAEHKGAILTGTVLQYVDHAMGRLQPGEAYALALTSVDDSLTIVWTDEIAQAWGVAAPLFSAGDKFGARQAFMEAYGRVTGEARALRRQPEVQVSLGHETEGRARAVKEAIAAGRLCQGVDALPMNVRGLLELPAPRDALALPAPEKALAGPNREALEKLAALRDAFATKTGRQTRQQVLARAERMRLSQAKSRAAQAVQNYQLRGVA